MVQPEQDRLAAAPGRRGRVGSALQQRAPKAGYCFFLVLLLDVLSSELVLLLSELVLLLSEVELLLVELLVMPLLELLLRLRWAF